MRTVVCDGSPARLAELVGAIGDALDGGPAVLPAGAAAVLPRSSDALPGGASAGLPRSSDALPAGAAAVLPRSSDALPGGAAAGRVADGTAVVVGTSGSSGDPKLVELPAAALCASADATARRLGGPARWLLALPAEHVAGVQVIVRALLAGAAPAVQDLRDGFRPEDFAAATSRLDNGRRCTSLVPTQLLRLLDAGGAALAALCSYDAVLVGGAALDPALRARADAAGARVVATYGMTETCGGCVYDGVPLDGVDIALIATGSDPSPTSGTFVGTFPTNVPRVGGRGGGAGGGGAGGGDGGGGGRDGAAMGLIVVGGVTVARGYLGRPDATAAAFAGGRFRTDDLGRLGADGRLEVLGRADDVIVTGGEKVAPAAVERALAAQPGVRAACVVGLPDPVWGQVVAAAVVPDPGGAPPHDRLRAAVRVALGHAAVPRRLLDLPELPLRGVGKPDRAAVVLLLSAYP